MVSISPVAGYLNTRASVSPAEQAASPVQASGLAITASEVGLSTPAVASASGSGSQGEGTDLLEQLKERIRELQKQLKEQQRELAAALRTADPDDPASQAKVQALQAQVATTSGLLMTTIAQLAELQGGSGSGGLVDTRA